jgi:hypothetical protein
MPSFAVFGVGLKLTGATVVGTVVVVLRVDGFMDDGLFVSINEGRRDVGLFVSVFVGRDDDGLFVGVFVGRDDVGLRDVGLFVVGLHVGTNVAAGPPCNSLI